jgi:hypothetical protein
MSDKFPSLAEQYRAFCEVSPYYVLLGERPLGQPARTQRIQAGFNVDVYGVRPEDNKAALPLPQEYAPGYAELERIAQRVSQHACGSCVLEAIPFSSTAIIDSRHHGQVEAMIRIQISHERGLNQPAGPPEQRALEEVEDELKSLGIVHR